MTAAMAAPITRRRCGRCGGTEQNYDLMELIQSSLIKFVSADGFERAQSQNTDFSLRQKNGINKKLPRTAAPGFSVTFLFAFIFENYSATEPFLLKLSIDLLAKGSGGEGHERKPSGSFLQSE